MAGQLVIGKGIDPATPSTGYTTDWSDLTTGQRKSKADTGVVSILSPSDRVNYIRNSGFWFAQRQAPASATTYSSTAGRAFSADGWAITNENASATFRRVDTSGAVETGMQGRFYGAFLKTTSNGKLCVSQCIEGTDAQALKGRVVRIQAWMKGDGATPTIKFGVLELQNAGTVDTLPATFISAFGGGGTNPTFGTNLAFLASTAATGDNVTITSNVASATLTSVWQRFGFTVTVSSNAKNLVVVFFSDAQITATQGFDLGQVSLTDGYEIQDWTPKSTAAELAWCSRFYQRSFGNESIAPAQNAGLNTGEYRGIAGKAGATAQFVPIAYQVPFRITPATVTLYNPAAADAQVRDVTGAVTTTASTVTGSTLRDFYVACTGNAATAVGNLLAIHWTADAEL